MARSTSDVARDVASRPRAIDPLDLDLLESLEDRDRYLYAILSATTRYRAILHEELQLLRAGKNPELVRGAMGRWHEILREIRNLAGHL